MLNFCRLGRRPRPPSTVRAVSPRTGRSLMMLSLSLKCTPSPRLSRRLFRAAAPVTSRQRLLLRLNCRAFSQYLGQAPENDILPQATWSVKSLLPDASLQSAEKPISPDRLRHLLRLSALPMPEHEEEEAKMMETLSSQVQFVKEIQRVDMTGLQPLQCIRDETTTAAQESAHTLNTMKEALDQEQLIGTHYKRIRRDSSICAAPPNPGWDALKSAEKRDGRYFVVDSQID